jgi:hypothetical protein
LSPEMLERIATIAGAVLTVMIFSYLLGDNFLYRIGISIFIGAAAAYLVIAAVESVIIPWVNATILAQPFDPPRVALGITPFLFALLLMLKGRAVRGGIGNLTLALLIGVGTALALYGAISGTLLPLAAQTGREFRPETIVEGFIAVVGTISVLIYFTYFGVRRANGDVVQILPVRAAGLVGQVFITITLGATYALLIISALTVLTGVIADRLLVLIP